MHGHDYRLLINYTCYFDFYFNAINSVVICAHFLLLVSCSAKTNSSNDTKYRCNKTLVLLRYNKLEVLVRHKIDAFISGSSQRFFLKLLDFFLFLEDILESDVESKQALSYRFRTKLNGNDKMFTE